MATVANKESTSAMAKGLGGCAAVGTFFSIIDTVRNPNPHNLTSVCIFAFACWALLKCATLVNRPSFAMIPQAGHAEAVLGRGFGAPAWVQPVIWVALFLLMICLFAALSYYRSMFGLSTGAVEIGFMAILALYLLGCQKLARLTRSYLRRWYRDRPIVAIGADGLWITGTQIPWNCIRGIDRRTRHLKLMRVDAIHVQAQGAKRFETIEIDLSDVVENADGLYARLRSAAAAHGAMLLPEGQRWGAGLDSRATRERLRAARQRSADWRAGLSGEIAKTEARLEDAESMVAQAEAKIRSLEAVMASKSGEREQIDKQLKQARESLRTRVGLRDATQKLLMTQRNAVARRR